MISNNKPIFPHVFDNTMRKEWLKCETAAMYRHGMGLQSNEAKKVDLHAGAAFAKGLEVTRLAFYADKVSPSEAIQKGIAALYKEYGDFVPPSTSHKTADRMAGALTFFFEERPLDTEIYKPVSLGQGLAVEYGFKIKLPLVHPDDGEPLWYAGRFDMLAEHDGSFYVVDEKTTSTMGEKWANQWFLDSQMTGYCFGARNLLNSFDQDPNLVKGALIHGVAIKKYGYEFVQLPVMRQDWEINRWYEQLLRDISRWKDAYITNKYNQNLDHSCAYYNNPCDFAPLCKSKNPERLIEGTYQVARWNPVERK